MEERSVSPATWAAEEVFELWVDTNHLEWVHNVFVTQDKDRFTLPVAGVPLSLHQNRTQLGVPGCTGTTVWDASVVLAKFLEYHGTGDGVHGKRVLEVGSGCGLGGCAAWAMGAAEVSLTDTADVLPILRKNSQLTQEAFGPRSHVRQSRRKETHERLLRVEELEWGITDVTRDLEIAVPVDVVLAADCVYSEESSRCLVNTLRSLCGTETVVYMAQELRNADIHTAFLEEVISSFFYRRIPQGDLDPDFTSPCVVVMELRLRND